MSDEPALQQAVHCRSNGSCLCWCVCVCVCMRDWRINDRELISHLAHMCMACIWSQNLIADSYLGFIRRGFGTLETQ